MKTKAIYQKPATEVVLYSVSSLMDETTLKQGSGDNPKTADGKENFFYDDYSDTEDTGGNNVWED